MVSRENALLDARMARNQHRRTPLHHAVAKNRLRMVQLLLELGADPNARDATGATALTTASQVGADLIDRGGAARIRDPARLAGGGEYGSLRRGRGNAA